MVGMFRLLVAMCNFYPAVLELASVCRKSLIKLHPRGMAQEGEVDLLACLLFYPAYID
jgi:hypothetical protein